jgi:hypothetical protein
MQIYHFKCNSCGYEPKLSLGSSDVDQTLTDVNADYSEYRLFKCQIESKFVLLIFMIEILKASVIRMEVN